jgi:hypothetical protein
MMTGKFPYKNGFQNYELQVIDEIGVPLSNKLLPAYLKELGYHTAMYGKWNIGHCNTKYLPHERGFDHFVGYMCPGHGYSDYICGLSSGVRDMLQGSAQPSSASVSGAEATSSGDMTYSWATGEEYLGTYDTELYRDLAAAVSLKRGTTCQLRLENSNKKTKYSRCGRKASFFVWVMRPFSNLPFVAATPTQGRIFAVPALLALTWWACCNARCLFFPRRRRFGSTRRCFRAT